MADILKIDSTIQEIENKFRKELMENGTTPQDKVEIKITLHGHELYYGRYKWNGKSLLIQEFRKGNCDLEKIL